MTVIKRIKYLYYLPALVVIAFANTVALSQDLRREIENIIIHDTDITYDLTPGFIVGFIDGEEIYFEAFGHEGGSNKDIQTDAIFEIGSITKLFTAALVDIAIEEGKFKLNTKVNDLLPLQYQNPRLSQIDIDDLVNHQSPLPRRPPLFGENELDWQNPYEYYTKINLLESYAYLQPTDQKYSYSHMNYALLEVILENVYNSTFEDLLIQKIIEPLDLNQTFIEGQEDKSIITQGLDRSGKPAPLWNFSSFAASEGLKSSANDMIKFLKAYLTLENTELARLWSDNLDLDLPSFEEGITVSYAWQKVRINKKTTAAIHTGTTSGHSSFIGMIKETGTGVIVLSNSSYGTRNLGMLVLRMINYNWKRKSN